MPATVPVAWTEGVVIRQFRVFARVMREPRLARIEVAYLLYSLTEFGTWTAVMVYAFERGGIAETGVAAFGQLTVAAAVAPFAAYLGDRFRRDHVLALGFLLTGASALVVAAAMSVEAPPLVVYGTAAVVAASTTVARPAASALLPALTDTATGLTAASVGLDVIVNLAVFAGPGLAGLLLVVGDPALVFTLGGVACLAAGASVVALDLEPARVRPTGRPTDSLAAELRSGLDAGWGDARSRTMLALATAGFVVAGALDVFFVSIAFDLVGGGESLAGFFGAAHGLGGLVGAAASIALIGGAQVRRSLAAAALAVGLPLVLVAVQPDRLTAALGLAACGVGVGALHVGTRTFLQRTTADDVLARVFGVMEALSQVALGVGALVTGLAVDAVGTRSALVWLAALLPGAVALSWRALTALDREVPRPDPDVLDALGKLPEFDGLAPAALEQVALNARLVRARAGDVIIRRGDRGDRFYVVRSGSVRVHRGDDEVADLGPGASFGEIALVRDVARTADVTAAEDATLLAVGRDVFLEAVTGHPRVRAAIERAADDRLE